MTFLGERIGEEGNPLEDIRQTKLVADKIGAESHPSGRPHRVRQPRRAVALCILALTAVSAVAACRDAPPRAIALKIQEDAIAFQAIVTSAAFEAEGDASRYHFLVWDEGRAADASLFRSLVSDEAVLDALESLGAEPGDALTIDTWDERRDPTSNAPDRVIEGPRVEVRIALPGQSEALPLEEILEDPGGLGFDMRFGGHRHNISEWHSGCVICLYSCPGSKVGNARYTVRDFVEGATRFSVREAVLPEDGTEVTIWLRLVDRRTDR